MKGKIRKYWHILTLGLLLGLLPGYFAGAYFEKRMQQEIIAIQKEHHQQDLALVEKKAEEYRHQLLDPRTKIPDLVDDKARELWESMQERGNAVGQEIDRLLSNYGGC